MPQLPSAPAAGPSSADQPPLVIGIPTYRRPGQLRELLDTLLPELREHPALVIVADNDCGQEAHAVIVEFNRQWPLAVCVPVPERGVAQVRNTLVREAGARCPGWQWLLMLDDDGLATPGWLGTLLRAGVAHKADLVGGPVEGVLPEGSGVLARNSVFASRRRWKTGPVPTLNTTQNLGIARSALALIGEPLFRREYGASGGEDYDLFRRVARAGGKLVWCDEAVINEPAPASRLTPRALLYRYASTGVYMALIDRSYDGGNQVWTQAVKGLVGALLATAKGLAHLDPDKAARGLLMSAHMVGRIGGLLGAKSSRYVEPAVKKA
ncbi:glycosyltransferase family 2 protein [Derxia gummosa]|uniref:Glycosyltransferase family 2 protein n=1 Tax=Derxia gummosa DSM 723 TaxID=1121388 RepID=A0A8B6X0J1_9BURK|nr:glycosyltransferase [Derxia gummosa]